MNYIDFAFSSEGEEYLKEYRDMFLCDFGMDEPSGRFSVGNEMDAYLLPNDLSLLEFKNIVKQSVETGTNLLIENHGELIEYDEDCDY